MKEERVAGSTLADEQKINDSINKIKMRRIDHRDTRGLGKERTRGQDARARMHTRRNRYTERVRRRAVKDTKRAHDTREHRSCRLPTTSGFKLNFHYMPGLPGTDKTRDLEGLKMLFSNPDYRPDMLKLYPCMVQKDSKLYAEWKRWEVQAIDDEIEAAELMAEAKGYVEPYCRVTRVQRDIPPKRIEAGTDKTNPTGCRGGDEGKGDSVQMYPVQEVGRTKDQSEPTVRVMEYEASLGRETSISIENDSSLFGFCRLRSPSQYGLRPGDHTQGSALIRELHVYGKSVRIGGAGEEGGGQHHGLGRRLMETAEQIALENGMRKMVVISGRGQGITGSWDMRWKEYIW